ncbi:MAG: hypothetical protein V3V08_10070, partial [Nannocystaceae bacterium]
RARRLKAARRRHGASNDLKGRPVPWLAGRFRRSIQALAAGLPGCPCQPVDERSGTHQRGGPILAIGGTSLGDHDVGDLDMTRILRYERHDDVESPDAGPPD